MAVGGPARALDEPLALANGRVTTLAEMVGQAPALVVIVERDCPTSQGALRALAASDPGRVIVVSQGRVEAAAALIAETGTPERHVLVEPAPYPVSAGFQAGTVPTFVLLEGGAVTDVAEGFERARVAALVARVGGDLRDDGGLGEHKPGCQSRHTLDPASWDDLEAADAELSGGGRIDDMWTLGWHDGLPTVPTTSDRVTRMLGGRDPDTSLGRLRPSQGEVTYQRLAACAVLAGCEPAYWPVVEAAATAILDDRFNAGGVISTTHFASPWLVVNGPIRQRLGMNAAAGVLGPGNRPNATIGRAIRLLMQLTGGGSPGKLDQSVLGGPHKYTACFPEREEASPWEPLHVTRGHEIHTSTVTVISGGSPAGVSDHTSSTPEELAATLALSMSHAWSPTAYPFGRETLLVLCPEHARTFGDAGWSKRDLQEFVLSHTRRTVGELRATGSGERTATLANATDPATVLDKFTSADQIVPVVAGGDGGRFSAIISPFHNSDAVTKTIDDQES